MNAEQPKVVLVGVGRMGQVHATALATHDTGLRAVAAVEPDPHLARRAAEILGPGVTIYSTPEEGFAHTELEACVIATPTPTHAPLAKQAFAAGLHVFCEKPLSFRLEDSQAVGVAAEQAGRLLQVGFWRRFAAPWVKAKEIIDSGRIGRPVWVRSSQWDAVVAKLSFCDPAVSGGLIVDFGVHDFDLVEWLTGERIEQVETEVLRLVDPELERVRDIDNAQIRLRLTGGISGLIDLSRNAAYGDDVRTEILGEKGAVFVDTLPHGSTRVGTADGTEIFSFDDEEDAFLVGIAAELSSFAEALAGRLDAEELPGAEADSRALRNALAARRSAEIGRPVNPERDEIATLPTQPAI